MALSNIFREPRRRADRRYWYSFCLVVMGLTTYICTGNGDFAILHFLGAIWLRMPDKLRESADD